MFELSLSNFLNAALAGIAGTLAMTAFMYLLSLITHKQIKVTKILGTMLTMQTQPGGELSESSLAITVGIIAHYLVGIGFTFCYLLLWHFHIGGLEVMYAALFGFLSGIFGILIWRGFIAIHPNPPDVPLKSYLLSLVLAHIVFGLVSFWAYDWLSSFRNMTDS